MVKTIIALLFVLSSCGSRDSKFTDGSVVSVDSQVNDIADSGISDGMIDSGVDSWTPPVDSSIADAAIDSPNVMAPTCSSSVSINDRDVFVTTIVLCPSDRSVDITTKIFSGDILLRTFLQRGVGCDGLSGLRLSERSTVTRVEITFEMRDTGESGTCSQISQISN